MRLTSWKDGVERTVEYEENETLTDLLRRSAFFIDGVLVMQGKDPIPLDTPLEDLEDITVIEVMSGG